MAERPATGRGDAEYDPAVTVTHDVDPGEVLVAGFASVGLAGLTAVDYLVDARDLEQVGHVTVDQFPAITPFEAGTPRHHTRLFAGDDLDMTVMVGELLVPLYAADQFSEALFDWVSGSGLEEIVVAAGVPVPHGPEDHRTFYIATEDYQAHRLGDGELPPMGSGFMDGINARLLERGLDSDLRVGVLVTPVHARAPDAEASLRLLQALTSTYDIDVDVGPLEAFAEDLGDYYSELQERLTSVEEEQRPMDRMYQ